jgi:hypothetical protein
MFSSPESAENWFNIFTAIGIIGAILVVIGGLGAWRADSAKEHYSDLRISDNERKTAEANQKTEELRHENYNLKVALAPRTLTENQVRALKSLKGKIHDVSICSEVDAESLWLATQVANALASVDINILLYSRSPDAHGTANMLYDPNAFQNPHGSPTNGEPLASAMEHAGLFHGARAIMSVMPMDIHAPKNVPMIIIGGKPFISLINPYIDAKNVN